jgi:integrase
MAACSPWHLARQAQERLAAGAGWQDHGLLFPSAVGTPMGPDNFSHWFTRLCDRAGLGHRHPHDMRHSGASLMLAQGVKLEVGSEVLAHASITVTKDVYGHLVEGEKRQAAVMIADALLEEDGSQDGSQRDKRTVPERRRRQRHGCKCRSERWEDAPGGTRTPTF